MSASLKTYFNKLSVKYKSSSPEEKACCDVLFNDNDIAFGDKRLNNIAALTYNITSSDRIFNIIEKSISPTENPWKTIYKALLLLHTIILYGSEVAIDKCISLSRFILPLESYNSALVKKGLFGTSGGTDYGAPVRSEAKVVNSILRSDQSIRQARSSAKQGNELFIPLGIQTDGNKQINTNYFEKNSDKLGSNFNFGQGLENSVGAGFGLQAVPGMYEGRPERYFDNLNDPRNQSSYVQNHQHTRDVIFFFGF